MNRADRVGQARALVCGSVYGDPCRCLLVVIELHSPAPLRPVGGVPPCQEDSGLAAGENDGTTDVTHVRPAVLSRNLPVPYGQPGHWPLRSPLETAPPGDQIAVVRQNIDVHRVWSGVNQEHIGRIEPSAGERQSARGRVRVPKVPSLRFCHRFPPCCESVVSSRSNMW